MKANPVRKQTFETFEDETVISSLPGLMNRINDLHFNGRQNAGDRIPEQASTTSRHWSANPEQLVTPARLALLEARIRKEAERDL